MTNVLDLFAGCGGLSHGLEQAGFTVIGGNDIAAAAAATHERNHKASRFFLGSITEESVRNQILEHAASSGCDVVVGGPPCQAYSVAGKRDVDDSRGHLFEDYVKIVEQLRPRFFVMENVKGLLSMKHDREDLSTNELRSLARLKAIEKEQIALRLLRKQSKNTTRIQFGASEQKRLDELAVQQKIIRAEVAPLRESVPDKIVHRFEALGYRVQYKLLNAADFGVPQRRERVIFIGTRLNVPIRFPRETHVDPASSRDIFDTVRSPWLTTRQAIGDLERHPQDIPWSHEFTAHKPEFVRRLHATPVGGSVYEGFSDAWFRQPPDEPSRTVKENHGGVFVHYALPRVLTPRELARLQSFPDDFLFEGSKSKVLVQIGNAVPPGLGRAIGYSIREMIDDADRAEALLRGSASVKRESGKVHVAAVAD